MRQNRVHLMPPMSNFYARICVKATPSSNNSAPKGISSCFMFILTFAHEFVGKP